MKQSVWIRKRWGFSQTGHKGGVSALMKKENPMLVNVHCLVHRLALCTSQAASDTAKLKNYQQIITDIYYYFSKSAKRSTGFEKSTGSS